MDDGGGDGGGSFRFNVLESEPPAKPYGILRHARGPAGIILTKTKQNE